jgi:hypothetical protein
MTLKGDTTFEADELIHSIAKLGMNDVKSFTSQQVGDYIYNTFIRKTETPSTNAYKMLKINLNGPEVSVLSPAGDSDVVIKLTNKPYGSTTAAGESKQFTLKSVKVNIDTKMELTASKDNKPDFTPGNRVNLEQYFKFTGPV